MGSTGVIIRASGVSTLGSVTGGKAPNVIVIQPNRTYARTNDLATTPIRGNTNAEKSVAVAIDWNQYARDHGWNGSRTNADLNKRDEIISEASRKLSAELNRRKATTAGNQTRTGQSAFNSAKKAGLSDRQATRRANTAVASQQLTVVTNSLQKAGIGKKYFKTGANVIQAVERVRKSKK